MKVLRLFKESLKGLNHSKLNTSLMMLGIVIGIAALTVIVSIGQGAKVKVIDRMNSYGFGSDAFLMASGGGKIFSSRRTKATTLSLKDAEDIRQLPNAKVVGVYQRERDIRVAYKNKNKTTRVEGSTPLWQVVRKWDMKEGRFIEDQDVTGVKRVAVIGNTIVREFFGNETPIGKYIRIKNVFFEVIGILERKGTTGGGHDADDRLVIPITTSAQRIFNRNYLNSIRVLVNDPSKVNITAERAREILRKNHRLPPSVEDDFRVITAEGLLKRITESSRTLNQMLVLISTISLLVSGIVIMNIMLVSVNERIREIGIKRSLGATRRAILLQFLMEAVLVALFGGIIGIALGLVIAKFLPLMTSISTAISWQPFVLGFAFSFLVGVLFGMQPARKATQLNPVEAFK
ncbi:MAG TPA: ABC transporter permease [Nitrospinota bacterium]|nr:ABC transporter permease [Nitrospinota bacterium]